MTNEFEMDDMIAEALEEQKQAEKIELYGTTTGVTSFVIREILRVAYEYLGDNPNYAEFNRLAAACGL